MIFKDELLLRNLKRNDCERIWEWLNDTAITMQPVPFNKFSGWFEYIFKKKNIKVKVVQKKNQPIGVIKFDPIAGSRMCQIVLVIDKKYRGKGVGGEALEQAIYYAKSVLKMEILIVNLRAKNLGGIKLFKNFGFEDFIADGGKLVLKRTL